MTILEIIKEPNPLLRKKSSAIENIDDKIKSLMNSMLETMHYEGGIGIAAIQVGEPIRALIIDSHQIESQLKEPIKALMVDGYKIEDSSDGKIVTKTTPFVFIINPEITYLSQETVVLTEGCLSVRKEDGITFINGEVERPKSVNFTYLNLEGEKQELSIDGNESKADLWFARCFLHEYDHLEGNLFIDKVLYSPIEIVGDVEVLTDKDAHLEL